MRLLALAAVVGGCGSEPPSCVTAFSGAGSAPCVLRSDGLVVCWGGGQQGALGDGLLHDVAVPQRVPVLADVRAIAMGEFHGCAVDGAQDVWCWGRNDLGQVGDGTMTMQPAPTRVTGVAGPAAEVVTGQYHSCARLVDGSVECWGQGLYGDLGTGGSASSTVPVAAALPGTATRLVTGDRTTCAWLAGGDVACWGGVSPTGVAEATPVVVPALHGARDVSAGCHIHSCAALADGTVSCWGNNDYGALGNGSTTTSALPVRAGPITGIVQVAVGADHSCARTQDGQVWCWGRNNYGQLGTGNIDNVLAPIRVPGLPAVDDVIAGCASTCVRAGNEIYCWGVNDTGELGDGTFTNRIGPVRTLDVCAR